MNMRKGIANILILIEVIVLVLVLVMSAVTYIRGPKTATGQYTPANSNESNDNENAVQMTVTETAEEPEAEESEEEVSFASEITEKVSAMTTEQKVAQLFVTTPESLTGNDRVTIAREGTKTALTTYPVGGLLYSRDSFQGRQQFGALLSGAQRYNQEVNSSYLLLAAYGTNAEGNTVTAFSEVYDTTPLTELVAANQMQGDESGIVYPVLFPDEEEQVTENASYVMLQNIIDESLTGDGENPCSMSEDAVGYIRKTLHYQGVIVTEDLAAPYITELYPDSDAAVQAVLAGADLILISGGFQEAYEAVLDAAKNGTIPMEQIDHAVCRILTAKAAMPEPTDGDLTGNEAAAAGNQNNTAPAAQNNGQTTDTAAQNTDNTAPADAATQQTPAETPDNGGQQTPETPQQ